MKTRISIPLVCLAAVCVFAVPDVQAGDFGPRASHVRRCKPRRRSAGTLR